MACWASTSTVARAEATAISVNAISGHRIRGVRNPGEFVMTDLATLWLPILLAAVFAFIASSIIHMTPLWHKNEYPPLPNEEAARAAIGALDVPPGDYMLPRCRSMKEYG